MPSNFLSTLIPRYGSGPHNSQGTWVDLSLHLYTKLFLSSLFLLLNMKKTDVAHLTNKLYISLSLFFLDPNEFTGLFGFTIRHLIGLLVDRGPVKDGHAMHTFPATTCPTSNIPSSVRSARHGMYANGQIDGLSLRKTLSPYSPATRSFRSNRTVSRAESINPRDRRVSTNPRGCISGQVSTSSL